MCNRFLNRLIPSFSPVLCDKSDDIEMATAEESVVGVHGGVEAFTMSGSLPVLDGHLCPKEDNDQDINIAMCNKSSTEPFR